MTASSCAVFRLFFFLFGFRQNKVIESPFLETLEKIPPRKANFLLRPIDSPEQEEPNKHRQTTMGAMGGKTFPICTSEQLVVSVARASFRQSASQSTKSFMLDHSGFCLATIQAVKSGRNTDYIVEVTEKRFSFCPIYENSTSLCEYMYTGSDLRWPATARQESFVGSLSGNHKMRSFLLSE